MKAKEYLNGLRNKSVGELQKVLSETKKELFSLKFRQATNQLNDTSQIKKTKRKIAQIQTIITHKNKKMLCEN